LLARAAEDGLDSVLGADDVDAVFSWHEKQKLKLLANHYFSTMYLLFSIIC
jgi:hypothetical protein